MVYPFHELKDEQEEQLAKWQFQNCLKKRSWILILLFVFLIASLNISFYIIAGLFCAILAVQMPLLMRNYRKLWLHERQFLPSSGFLTVTESGVMTETNELTTFYPWKSYIAARMVDTVLVLVLPNLQVHVWNVQNTPASRREELLIFASDHVGKTTAPPIHPPQGEYTPCKEMTPPQALETGDIIHTCTGKKRTGLRLFLLLIYSLFFCINLLAITEKGTKSLYLCGLLMFGYYTWQTLLLLQHPGRRKLQQILRAHRINHHPTNNTYCLDNTTYTSAYHTGVWVRGKLNHMKHIWQGQHICVAQLYRPSSLFILNLSPPAYRRQHPTEPTRNPSIGVSVSSYY